jgi:hypothetical protein
MNVYKSSDDVDHNQTQPQIPRDSYTHTYTHTYILVRDKKKFKKKKNHLFWHSRPAGPAQTEVRPEVVRPRLVAG